MPEFRLPVMLLFAEFVFVRRVDRFGLGYHAGVERGEEDEEEGEGGGQGKGKSPSRTVDDSSRPTSDILTGTRVRRHFV